VIGMSTRRTTKILPPNSTALELDLLQGVNRFPLLRAAAPSITRAKLIDMPDSYLPWLIEEYGLEPFVQFFGGDRRRAIREGVPLIRKIGTPYAVKKLLELGGYPGSRLEEEPAGEAHWSEFQVELPFVPQTLSQIATAQAAIGLGKPLTRRLARMYAGLDVRPAMLDEGLWEDVLLDDYSGIRLDPNGPVLSFGQEQDFVARLPNGRPIALFAAEQSLCIIVHNTDVFRLDEGILEMDDTRLNTDFSIGVSAVYLAQRQDEPSFIPDIQTIVQAMVVADEQHLFGDLNMTFARSRIVEVGDNLMLDEGVLDMTGIASHEEPIDRLVERLIDAKILPRPHTLGFTGKVQSEVFARRTMPAERVFAGHQRYDLGNAIYADYPGAAAWRDSPWPDYGYTWESYRLPFADFKSSANADGTRITKDGAPRVTTDGRSRDAVVLAASQ
jgi:P2-related tail formation protein